MSLLVLWVPFVVGQPPLMPLHLGTVPAMLLDGALGLEPESRLQAGQGEQDRGEATAAVLNLSPA